jgi:hypothetical protein
MHLQMLFAFIMSLEGSYYEMLRYVYDYYLSLLSNFLQFSGNTRVHEGKIASVQLYPLLSNGLTASVSA